MTVSNDIPILSVTQLSQAIKHCLESTFLNVTLQGEISNFKPHTSGHLYFSLKDANSQISAVMFRPYAQSLKSLPKDGTQVIVKGEINVYPQSGKYQILIREMRPVGLGELLLKLEELKIKLNKKGWFKTDRKRPLPKFPKRIGVVTSPTGAAIQDMLNILNRRFSGFHLILNPVKVQGEGAAAEIAKAIEQFNQYDLVDVIIIGRGGGSIEDLWTFNEEIVAEAIFNSRLPIISAVGHETDHCIADYVADVRAPTPSAAAEIVIAEKSQQLQFLAQLKKRMQQTVVQLIKHDRLRLLGLLRHSIFQTPFGLLGPWSQHLDDIRTELHVLITQKLTTQRYVMNAKQQLLLSLKPAAKLIQYRQKIVTWEKELLAAMQRKFVGAKNSINQIQNLINHQWNQNHLNRHSLFQMPNKVKQLDHLQITMLKHKKERLELIKNSLHSINPKNLLTKGYCILFSENKDSAITSVDSVKTHQNVQILLADGDLQATVKEIIYHD